MSEQDPFTELLLVSLCCSHPSKELLLSVCSKVGAKGDFWCVFSLASSRLDKSLFPGNRMLIHVLPMRVMTFGSCLSLTPIPQTTFSTSVSQFLYRWPNSAVSCELEGRAKNKGEWTEYRITDLAGASSFSAKNDQTLHARWIAADTFSLCSLITSTYV